MGIGLLVLWILSPLAGQASLRIIDIGAITGVTIPTPWYVLNTTDFPIFTTTAERCDFLVNDIVSVGLMTAYAEAISSGAKTCDQKGNPLLPMPGEKPDKRDAEVSSFAGVQVLGSALDDLSYGQSSPSSRFNIDIAMRSANISFPFTIFEFNSSSPSAYSTNSSWTTMLGPDDGVYIPGKPDLLAGSGFFIGAYTNMQPSSPNLQTITFGSFLPGNVTLWICGVGYNTRNIEMDCDEDSGHLSCQWTAIGDSTHTSITPLVNNTIASQMFAAWSLIDKGSSTSASFTERYIADGGTLDLSVRLVNLTAVDNVTFSSRLTTAFNTFWMLARQMDINMTDTNSAGCVAGRPGLIQTTASTPLALLPIPIIVCNWAWFSILTFTTTLLLFCAIMNLWFHYHINTPDIMGYVSSMAIENPYLPIPGEHPGARSVLDGLERAKVLGDMKVKIGDVRSGEEVGKIAFAAKGNGVVTYEKGRNVI
jgi:hypothetical protein